MHPTLPLLPLPSARAVLPSLPAAHPALPQLLPLCPRLLLPLCAAILLRTLFCGPDPLHYGLCYTEQVFRSARLYTHRQDLRVRVRPPERRRNRTTGWPVRCEGRRAMHYIVEIALLLILCLLVCIFLLIIGEHMSETAEASPSSETEAAAEPARPGVFRTWGERKAQQQPQSRRQRLTPSSRDVALSMRTASND